MELQLLPNILDYTNSKLEYGISVRSIDRILHKISSHTGLSKIEVEVLARNFFTEIRRQLLNGNDVCIENFGKFYLRKPTHNSSPSTAHFKLHKVFAKELNGKR